MKSPKAPSPPDPVATAGAQTGMNVGTSIADKVLNNTNQITPYGNLTYNQTGMTKWTDPLSGKSYDIPQYTATQTLSPEQQKLYNSQTKAGISMSNLANQQLGKLGGILGSQMNLSGAPKVTAPQFAKMGNGPNLATTYGDPGGYARQTKQVQDAIMAKAQPGLNQERSRLQAELANKGIGIGTEAYDRAMAGYGTNVNDMRLNAILAGGQEQSRLAGLDQAKATFGNNAAQQMFANRLGAAGFNNQWGQQGFGNQQALRGQYLNEAYQARNQPLNEIAALLGGGQVQNPNFVNTPSSPIANTDYAGMVGQNYNQKLAAWQANQANNPMNGIMGGLFGLGSSAIMASDRRLKTDVTFLGMLRDLPIYAWTYLWGERGVGVMAQDMLTLRPDAVVPMGSYLAVDYSRL